MSQLIIELSLDGDQCCALVGQNIQDGFVGFGNTPNDAIRDLINEAHSDKIDLYNFT